MDINLKYQVKFVADVKIMPNCLLGNYANLHITSDPEEVRKIVERAVNQLVQEGVLHLVTGADVDVKLTSLEVVVYDRPSDF